MAGTMQDLVVTNGIDLETASSPFIGRWQKLVSTTNWEKGKIIAEWRTALEHQEVPVTEFSDEAWAQRVGGVTSQHVGRLRRVYQRFAGVSTEYQGLYWSHFQAALDWEDAEMWLEGAVQNKWSVSVMRDQRQEVHGAPDELKPRDEDILATEVDEETYSEIEEATSAASQLVEVADAAPWEDDGDEAQSSDENPETDYADDEITSAPREKSKPFANLPELPADLADAFESFKLAILHHKLAGWGEIGRGDVVNCLDALKELALAPTDG